MFRRAIDLEHWAAFPQSFDRLVDLLREVSAHPGVRTVVVLAGDVHYGQVDVAEGPGLTRPLWQVIASPMRQEVAPMAARAFAFARSPVGRLAGRALRRLSGAQAPDLQWRSVDGPILDNHVAVLETSARGARVRLLASRRTPGLATVVDRRLS